jgi:hypothetical protein
MRPTPLSEVPEALEDVASLTGEVLGEAGRRHAVGASFEKRTAEDPFKALDLIADRRRSQVQHFGGAGEASGLQHGVEDQEHLNRRKALAHD